METLKNIFNFYIEGFTNLSSVGKKLWLIIFIKLFVMFVILKLFFFQDFLSTKAETPQEKANYVIDRLTNF